jgi:hypothetical protein
MAIRLIVLILLFSACRSSDMACPEVKMVKLKKRPSNYLLRSSQRSLTASNRQQEKEKPKVDYRPQATRNVKTIDSIEEWDCPKPGTKVIPKSVKENIKKNRKKFETYYRSRTQVDSVQSRSPGNLP